MSFLHLLQLSCIAALLFTVTAGLAQQPGRRVIENRPIERLSAKHFRCPSGIRAGTVGLLNGNGSSLQIPPTVFIESPKMDALFVGPATVTIEAVAKDRDGSIDQVEFFDNGQSIGVGTSKDGERFVIQEEKLPYGPHSLVAIARDNEGLKATSNAANIFVNGPSTVTITSPKAACLIPPDSELTLIAQASDPSGVMKVQFFFSEQLLGEGKPTGIDEYSFSIQRAWRASFKIEAVVTNGAGLKTFSLPVRFTVSKKPNISLLKPANGASVEVGTNVGLDAIARQPDGEIMKVEFYANNELIGTTNDTGLEHFYFTWRDVRRGSYSLTAVATDELGVTSRSSPIAIVVRNKRPARVN